MTDITDAQIKALQIEASSVGDDEMVTICMIALGGHSPRVLGVPVYTRDEARALCAEAI